MSMIKIDTLADRLVHFSYNQTTKPSYRKYYISQEERHTLIDLSVNAYLLYEYYLEAASRHPNKMLDKDTAVKYFGLSESQVRRAHTVLVNNGFFAKQAYRRPDGVKGTYFYLGTEAVTRFNIERNSKKFN